MLNEEINYDSIEYAMKKRKSEKNPLIIKRLKTSINNEKLVRRKFEDFPNELIYEIFSYLTDNELFISFYCLTKDNRFNQLISNRTKINFRSIQRLEFLEKNYLINLKIIREIFLFNNDDTPGIINLFFSLYSFNLNETFPNLQNLVLDQPEQNDLMKLMKYFCHLKHLSIRLSTLVRMPSTVYQNLYSSIASENFKSLTIIDDPDEPIQLPEKLYFPSLRYLTLGSLTFINVQNILKSSPNLNYFKFYLNTDQSNHSIEEYIQTNLTQVDIDGPRAEFHLIEKILRQMNKLKSLKLICRGINATVWECFIKEFLPNLINFHFKFDIRQKNINLLEYQQDWWIKNKKWIVISHPLSPFIYTIPFIEKKFILNSRTAFRQNKCLSSKLSNEYLNIRQLIVTLNPIGFKSCQNDEIYFPCVESLTLIDYQNSQKPISHLINLINLSTVRHLTIDHRMRSSTFLLLIKHMPQLDSLSGQDVSISSITNKFRNENVLLFIKLNIKRLTISPINASNDIRYVSQLCFIFSHIHHLTLSIKSADQIWPWINKLNQLRSATVFCRHGSFFHLMNHKYFLNTTYELRSHQDLRLWIR